MTHVKDTCYFSHDSNARRDPKILALRSVYGMEGYGWYWTIIEMLREQPGFMLSLNTKYAFKAIAMEIQCDEETAAKFVDDCIKELNLFETDGESFWSNSLLRRMEIKEEKSNKARHAANARWSKTDESDSNTDAMQTHSENSSSNASKVKGSKRNESTNKRVSSHAFADDSQEIYLAQKLKQHILANNSNARTPNSLQKWASEFDKMLRIDKRSIEDIVAVMEFSQADSFWAANILSPRKLREQFDKLFLQSKRRTRGDPQQKYFAHQHPVTDLQQVIQRKTMVGIGEGGDP